MSWYDAQAYVAWLNELEDSHRYFIPTESQWECAARGPALWQGRENRCRYPWGDGFDPHKCNVYESGLVRTTAVGFIVDGASPKGVLDMVGNFWEWCADWYDPKYYEKKTVEKNEVGNLFKMVRGGLFIYVGWDSRCVRRECDLSGYGSVGFRVARI